METVTFIVALIVILIGLLGTLVPLLPGLPLIFGSALVFAIIDGFNKIGWATLVIMLILTLIGLAADFVSGTMGAKRFGASKSGVAGSLLGMAAGFILLGPIGFILGPLLGAIIGELMAGKTMDAAFKTGTGSLVGFLGGAVIQFVIALSMVALFIYQVLV